LISEHQKIKIKVKIKVFRVPRFPEDVKYHKTPGQRVLTREIRRDRVLA